MKCRIIDTLDASCSDIPISQEAFLNNMKDTLGRDCGSHTNLGVTYRYKAFTNHIVTQFFAICCWYTHLFLCFVTPTDNGCTPRRNNGNKTDNYCDDRLTAENAMKLKLSSILLLFIYFTQQILYTPRCLQVASYSFAFCFYALSLKFPMDLISKH
jgi:hypothetical protein